MKTITFTADFRKAAYDARPADKYTPKYIKSGLDERDPPL